VIELETRLLSRREGWQGSANYGGFGVNIKLVTGSEWWQMVHQHMPGSAGQLVCLPCGCHAV
jgi:hypothetical protein